MSVVFFLIPLGILLVGIAVWAFVWAVNHDQFEDLDRAGESILFDDDEPLASNSEPPAPDTPEGAGATNDRSAG